MKSYVNTDGDA